MENVDTQKVGRIRHLNDLLRCKGIGGQVMMTAGLDALGPTVVNKVLRAVAAFEEFNGDNDPGGERDCATLIIDDLQILWKIDYFDRTLTFHSPDPSDPEVTRRVLTIMLAQEY
ncbi:MAG: DUF3768 domain-containing protein [Alphaproteobacteria bacterium]|nr:DUF3768 domain-containing protein [Alphaproteobacteria bacterium]